MLLLKLLVAMTLATPVFGTCAMRLPWCQQQPDRGDTSTAIFVGVVKSVMPPVPSTTRGTRRVYPVARFEVTERFVGASSAEFEVYSTSDFFLDTTPQQTPAFVEGQTWLVEAIYDPSEQRWMTSNCERTKRVEHASEELLALRAWASGQRLPARLTGQVVNPAEGKAISGSRVELRGVRGTTSTTTDASGRFAFENLEPGMYDAIAAGAGERRIDLTRAWCSFAVFTVKP